MILPSVSMLLRMTLIVGIIPPHSIFMEAWQSLIPLWFPRQCSTHYTKLPLTLSHASLGGDFLYFLLCREQVDLPSLSSRSLRRWHAGVVDSSLAAQAVHLSRHPRGVAIH